MRYLSRINRIHTLLDRLVLVWDRAHPEGAPIFLASGISGITFLKGGHLGNFL